MNPYFQSVNLPDGRLPGRVGVLGPENSFLGPDVALKPRGVPEIAGSNVSQQQIEVSPADLAVAPSS